MICTANNAKKSESYDVCPRCGAHIPDNKENVDPNDPKFDCPFCGKRIIVTQKKQTAKSRKVKKAAKNLKSRRFGGPRNW